MESNELAQEVARLLAEAATEAETMLIDREARRTMAAVNLALEKYEQQHRDLLARIPEIMSAAHERSEQDTGTGERA